MGTSGNGTKLPASEPTGLLDEQSEGDAAEASGEAGTEPAAAAGGGEGEELPAITVRELVNTEDGCWKVMSDGERLELTDMEWRKELARLLARKA